jgi:hypothetical protein
MTAVISKGMTDLMNDRVLLLGRRRMSVLNGVVTIRLQVDERPAVSNVVFSKQRAFGIRIVVYVVGTLKCS